MADTYICTACGEPFTGTRPEAEARAEQRKNFPDIPDEECMVICEDCFQRFTRWLADQQRH